MMMMMMDPFFGSCHTGTLAIALYILASLWLLQSCSLLLRWKRKYAGFQRHYAQGETCFELSQVFDFISLSNVKKAKHSFYICCDSGTLLREIETSTVQ